MISHSVIDSVPCSGYPEGVGILASILEQLKAADIIRHHLRYAIHFGVPVTYQVGAPLGQHGTVIVAGFEAVVSSDHRLEGSFRWPTDDHWVRVIQGSFSLTEEEVTRSRGTATQIILARIHACGIEMTKEVPQYVEVNNGVLDEG